MVPSKVAAKLRPGVARERRGTVGLDGGRAYFPNVAPPAGARALVLVAMR